MLLYVVLTVIIIYLIFKLAQIQNYWKNIGVTNHPSWPIIGYMAPFLVFKTKSLPEIFKDLYDSYPNSKYIGTNQFMQQVLIVRDVDLINKIIIKDFDHFTDRQSLFSQNDDSIAGRNLTELQGEKWRKMRNIISPAFTSNKMKIMFQLISDCANEFTTYFEKQQFLLKSFETTDIFTKFANDLIATVAFGITCNSLEQPNNEFYLMGKEVANISPVRAALVALLPSVTNFFGIQPIKKKVLSYFCGIIQECISHREKFKIVRPDLIHFLMEARYGHDDGVQDDVNDRLARPKLIDIDIAAQAFVFFFAGFDTTSTLMSLVSYELAVNPEIQEKLLSEIDEVRLSCEGKVTYEKLMGMKYLDMVLAETLRKSPPGFLLDRVCVKDYTIHSDNSNEKPLTIKKGQLVHIPVYGIHHDPQFYPNPEKFDPERFNKENKLNFNPRSYFPFGMGARSCIASRLVLLETKLLFFHFLSKFSLVVVDKTEIPIGMGKSRHDMLPENGNWLGFKRRK